MTKVLVVAETKGDALRKPTLELLGEAGRRGLEAEAVLIGHGVSGHADTLAGHGARRVYVADDEALGHFAVDRYRAAVVAAAERAQPDMVWLTAMETGKALGPAVAGRLRAPFIGDAGALELGEDGSVEVTRPAMATKVQQRLRFTGGGVKVLTVRGGAFEPGEGGSAAADVVPLAVPAADGRLTVTEVKREETGRIDLGEAERVVSVGRGVRGPEGVEAVQPLADALDAALGASRAVVDSGWLPYNHQVGQTGRVVTPDLYVAVGISGAIQHLAGMSGSKLIVAVNKDPDAPIFSVADYGIVGDLFQVVPIMTEEVKKHRS